MAVVRPGGAGRHPFTLRSTNSNELAAGRGVFGGVMGVVRGGVERLLAFPELNRIYDSVGGGTPGMTGQAFLGSCLKALGVTAEISEEDRARIPERGPVIVVSNHPYGGLDGMVLAHLLGSIRPDAKVMANFLLGRIPDLRELMIFVDPFGGKESVKANVKGMKESLRHLKNDGLLGIFPSGTVSHWTFGDRRVADPKWSDIAARLAVQTGAQVVPVYFEGGNSALFQVLGAIHPLLRTAMLPRELLNKKEVSVKVRVGNPIQPKKLSQFADPQELTAYLRMRTHLLGTRSGSATLPRADDPAALQEIAAHQPADLLARDVASLGDADRLYTSDDYEVYCVKAVQIPNVLKELGVLRETAFRQVAEGTGKASDVDQFDMHYRHLFVWSKEKREVVGAYRLGFVDEILPVHGVKGLYTSTLFKFDRAIIESLGRAIEVGRSFVRLEYQKNFFPLLLLWKGIGEVINREKKYTVLFGPVSINAEYASTSQDLMMEFLRVNSGGGEMEKWVTPRHPPKVRPLENRELKAISLVMKDVDEVSAIVSEIESDGKEVPVLIRQYLKLGAKVLGFNIDPDFGNVLDGLIYVDLLKTDKRVFDRYAGVGSHDRMVAWGEIKSHGSS